MDTLDLDKILDRFENSNIQELELTYKDFHLKCKKASVVQKEIIQKESSTLLEPKKEPRNETKKENSNLKIIKSPIVGTFYRAPSPDSKVYVEVGDIAEKGQTLCILEAMKMMNELESEYKCKIVEILANIGDLIEYDQPLFKVEIL